MFFADVNCRRGLPVSFFNSCGSLQKSRFTDNGSEEKDHQNHHRDSLTSRTSMRSRSSLASSSVESLMEQSRRSRKNIDLHTTEDTLEGLRQVREVFDGEVKNLLRKLPAYRDIDLAADELGTTHTIHRIAPWKKDQNKNRAATKEASAKNDITEDSLVRLKNRKLARAQLDFDSATNETQVILYFHLKNPREHHMGQERVTANYIASQEEPDLDKRVGSVTLESLFWSAIETLFKLPDGAFIRRKDLPLADLDDREILCDWLNELGLLEVK